MPRNIVGIDPVPKKFQWLEKTIKRWLEINVKYALVMEAEEDVLYWHNERANIGAFAGAAWKAGICAVEEYAAPKTPKSVTSKGSGRIDLYLANDDQDAIVEAKMCWVGPGTDIKTLRSKMDQALSDAKRDNDGNQKIAAVFYVIRIPEAHVDEKILIEEVRRIRKIRPNVLAWCFPANVRHLQSDSAERKGFVWPGVILALKLAPAD